MRGLVAARSLIARAASVLNRRDPLTDLPLMLVFSKDRAIQLELFLRSYVAHVSRLLPVTVLYRASTPAHAQGYRSVFEQYAALPLRVVAETEFKPDLLGILKNAKARKVLFFVDDMVFIRHVDSGLLFAWQGADGVLSLRLGLNITHSFNEGGISQPQPRGLEAAARHGHPLMRWRWSDGEMDWALPTALDGHLLPLSELIPVIEHTQFRAPNSLEAAMGQFKFLLKWRPGYCFARSRVMNLPLNSVKTEEFNFPHQNWDSEELLAAFQKGLRLDVSRLPMDQHNSCHMPWMPSLRPAVS